MKLGIYAMRDNLQGFLSPSVQLNDAVALREFKLNMDRKDTVFNFEPQDFSLYKLGEFDTDTGKITVIPLEVIA